MLIQPLRCIPKSSLNFICAFRLLSHSFSSNITPFSHSTTNPSLIPSQFPNPSPDSHFIASSFRDWFRISTNPSFDRIFDILNSKNEEELGNVDLDIELSERLVLDVLRYKGNDVLSCLKFFDWAGRQSDFRHTRSTYVAIFKILSRAKLNPLMLDLLDGFSTSKFIYRVRFYDILVIGYALAGKVDVALQLFGKMRFYGTDLDVVAYHVLFNALVDGACFDAVEVMLGQIRARGHENHVTRYIVVKSMCKQGRLVEAEEYMRDLVEGGEVVSGQMFSILVDGLCNKKMFSHASKLVHEFGEKGGVRMDPAYGIWIRNLVKNGQLDAALEFFNSKKSLEGYAPGVHRYNILINRLLKEDRLLEVCDLLMDMKESNVAPDKVTMNAVLCFFCKAGMADVAFELMKMSLEFGITPRSLLYDYMVNNLCLNGNTNEAYELLKNTLSQGYFPGGRAFSILANALCREGKLDIMKDLIVFALERNFILHKSTYEKFIKALCRARKVEDGYMIYGQLNRMNEALSASTYAYLISGFNNAGRGDLAGRLLIEMQEKDHKPEPKLFKSVSHHVGKMKDDKYFLQFLEMQLSRFGHDVDTYSYFIYGAGHARKPELGKAVFEMMEKYSLVPSLKTDIFMLQCFLKSDRISDAINFFVDIPKRRKLGRQLYNSMVVGLCKAGKSDYAAAFLREARNAGQNPGLECYEELIKLYCSENNFDQVIRVINDLQKAGRKVSSFIGNCLLLYSMHSGDFYKVWLRSRDVSNETSASATLGKLVAVFSDRVRVDTKVEELEEIVEKCFPLDLFTYNMLLRKLSINHMDEACQLFKRMCQKGIKPNRWTYDILVRALYKHGRLAEGQMWAHEMYSLGYVHS